MANVGHTTIDATGAPPRDLAALAAYLRDTARGAFAFTLSSLQPHGLIPDRYVT